MHLLQRGSVAAVHLNDVDRSIYAFWYAATRRNAALVAMINRTRVTVTAWDRQKEIQRHKDEASLLELGFSTLFLNRTNRSGILRGGIIGGRDQKGPWKIDARFNKQAVAARVEAIGQLAKKISISSQDARSAEDLTFEIGSKAILYLDPPYFQKGRDLYINHFSESDHAMLSKRIGQLKKCPWVVTYDNVPTIRKLYQGHRRKQFDLVYTADQRRIGSELMVFSSSLRIPGSVVG